jgi:hypothetical protein
MSDDITDEIRHLPALDPSHTGWFLRLRARKAASCIDAVAGFLGHWLVLLKKGSDVRAQLVHDNAAFHIEKLRGKQLSTLELRALSDDEFRQHRRSFSSLSKEEDEDQLHSWLVSQVFLIVALLDSLSEVRAWINKLSDKKMPPEARKYVSTLLLRVERGLKKPARRKNSGRQSERDRDDVIRHAVKVVAREFKLKPTRGRWSRSDTRPDSACSLVKKALERHGIYLSESTIEGIYSPRTVRNK